MKKKDSSKSKLCCHGENFEEIKKRAQEKFKKIKECAQKNPEKTKSILAGVGIFLVAVFGFIIGRKNKNKKNDK